jgi:hypothetical protein
MPFQIPQVPQAAAKHYADNAWHMGGIKPILDNTTLRFATDFANVCIRDATKLCYEYAKAQLLAEIRELKKQKAVDAEATPVQPEQKSSIILTD